MSKKLHAEVFVPSRLEGGVETIDIRLMYLYAIKEA